MGGQAAEFLETTFVKEGVYAFPSSHFSLFVLGFDALLTSTLTGEQTRPLEFIHGVVLRQSICLFHVGHRHLAVILTFVCVIANMRHISGVLAPSCIFSCFIRFLSFSGVMPRCGGRGVDFGKSAPRGRVTPLLDLGVGWPDPNR